MVEMCPRCLSKKYVKRGLSEGKQRYKRKECGKTFSRGAHSLKKKDFALCLYLNGNGIRQIGRVVNVAPSVVLS
jgi:transposase-like protein